ALDEKAGRGHRVVVDGERGVAQSVRRAGLRLCPSIDLTAQQNLLVQRAAEFQEPGDSTFAAARTATVTRELLRAVSEPEADPEALTGLGFLRRSLGSDRQGQGAEEGDSLRYRTH